MSDKVAILIVNYNLYERADALREHILRTVKWPYEIIVIDNGSDLVPPSKYTTLQLEKNVQTTGGWLAGLRYAKELRKDWFAYWFIITSAEFPEDMDMPLTPMAEFLKSRPDAVGIHPALTKDSTTAHTQLIDTGKNVVRQVRFIDNIASLYRADWFDNIGWFDPDLIYAWGIDIETCWKARKQKRSLWVHEGCQVKKITNIGYTMDRMNMTAEERGVLASINMECVLREKYGSDWMSKLNKYDIIPECIKLDPDSNSEPTPAPEKPVKKRTYYRLD